MRLKEYAPFKNDDKRIRTRFLWFPKTLLVGAGRNMQTRWLERASWVEYYLAGDWVRGRWKDD